MTDLTQKRLFAIAISTFNFIRIWNFLQIQPCRPTTQFAGEKFIRQQPRLTFLNKSQIYVAFHIVAVPLRCPDSTRAATIVYVLI